MFHRFDGLPIDNPGTRGMPIRLRVGLNSGDMVVLAIGSELHMDYTGVRQTTPLATGLV
jgi:class 3 adenylate cyclase